MDRQVSLSCVVAVGGFIGLPPALQRVSRTGRTVLELALFVMWTSGCSHSTPARQLDGGPDRAGTDSSVAAEAASDDGQFFDRPSDVAVIPGTDANNDRESDTSHDGPQPSSDGPVEVSGAAGTGSAGTAGSSGTAGGGVIQPESGDTPPWRPLAVTVAPGEHTHDYAGRPRIAGLDNRATSVGKLVVSLGASGNGEYASWFGRRGFHVLGVTYTVGCSGGFVATGHDVNAPGDCRLNMFDGLKHGDQFAVSSGNGIGEKVRKGLVDLQALSPSEDWGYFLNKDGSVRWSDVAVIGFLLTASDAAVIGKAVRLYRVVSISGPTDNNCGLGRATGAFDRSMPPWRTVPIACGDGGFVASWLDAPSATPVSRFVGFIGMQDPEYGNFQYAMERMHYRGEPTRWDSPGQPVSSTNRFYADTPIVDLLNAPPPLVDDALNAALGVPAPNQHPSF